MLVGCALKADGTRGALPQATSRLVNSNAMQRCGIQLCVIQLYIMRIFATRMVRQTAESGT